MSVLRSQIIWEECVSEELCVKILGKNECVEVNACVRITYEESNYFVEVEAFGERLKWNLTSACYDVVEYGIVRLRMCVNPSGDNGAKIVLEACLGVSGLSKCWTLISEHVEWSDLRNVQSDLIGEISNGTVRSYLDQRASDTPSMLSVSSPLSPHETEQVLSTEGAKPK